MPLAAIPYAQILTRAHIRRQIFTVATITNAATSFAANLASYDCVRRGVIRDFNRTFRRGQV
jgi:hypothetical protein